MTGLAKVNQYLLLAPFTDIKKTTEKINNWYKSRKKEVEYGQKTEFELQAFKDIYLKSDFNEPPELRGSITRIYVFSTISIFLLFIACVNYINLSTANALKKIRTTGIHKILGVERKHMVQRFLLEALIFFVLSFALANLIYFLAVPSLEQYLGHQLGINLLGQLGLHITAFGILLVVCLLTGYYPAWLFSGQQVLSGIKGNVTIHISGVAFRKGLITIQFIITIIVIIATIIVNTQLKFLNNKNLGYDKDNLLVLIDGNWGSSGKAFKSEVLKITGVEKAAISPWISKGSSSSTILENPEDKNTQIQTSMIFGDIDFAATLRLQTKAGRLFNPQLVIDPLMKYTIMKSIKLSPTISI
jgi:putative ABC transport system permease protein